MSTRGLGERLVIPIVLSLRVLRRKDEAISRLRKSRQKQMARPTARILEIAAPAYGGLAMTIMFCKLLNDLGLVHIISNTLHRPHPPVS